MKNKLKKLQFLLSPITGKFLWKIILLCWSLIVLTITAFIAVIIPLERNTALDRMNNEARDIAATIVIANSSAMIMGDYGLVVDYCVDLVDKSNSIQYLVITRKDGYSLLFYENGWEEKTLSGMWTPDTTHMVSHIINSPEIHRSVFHKTVIFRYLGIDWGFVHVGLSLENYHAGIKNTIVSLTAVTVLMALIGFAVSVFFARKITNPIRILEQTAGRIAKGDLDARAEIHSGDEHESLAASFNTMTESLKMERDNLEEKVRERTFLLEQTNAQLMKEITERTKIEESLGKSLKEKEVLLKEIHHRVKNNLQIVSALLNLQSQKVKDEGMLNIFRDSQSRIRSMALVHERLYRSKDLSDIDLREYIMNLVNFIKGTYSNPNLPVKIEYDLDNILRPIDIVIPLGLILNELVSNSLKHAFRGKDTDESANKVISIKMKKSDDQNMLLEIRDNGKGLPEGLDITKVDSLGLKLVHMLSRQIKSKLQIQSEKGVRFTLSIPL